MHNTLTLIGTITSEILRSSDEDGAPVAVFTLVTYTRRVDRATGRWLSGPPTYVPVVCGRRLAHNVVTSLRRGDPVIVTGRLRIRSGPDARLSRAEIEAHAIGPDLNRVAVRPAGAADGAVA